MADEYEKANALLSDMVINHKTVCSFGEDNIDLIFSKYSDLMSEPLNRAVKNAHFNGGAHGYSSCARMLFMGIIFYIGSIMVTKYDWPPEDVYICINVLMHAAFAIGMSLSNFPSVSRAKQSAKTIFDIVDEKSTLDVREGKNARIQEVKSGKIELKDVTFKYPSRDQLVMNKMNLEIPATHKIALVGASGCGKSTITNLLLRFYDPQAGQILIDGEPIEDFNV